jgi:hypothetical protein
MTTIIQALTTIQGVEQRIRDGIAATAAERDTILSAMDAEAQSFINDSLERVKQFQIAFGALRTDLEKSYSAQIKAAEEAIGATAQPAPHLAIAAE